MPRVDGKAIITLGVNPRPGDQAIGIVPGDGIGYDAGVSLVIGIDVPLALPEIPIAESVVLFAKGLGNGRYFWQSLYTIFKIRACPDIQWFFACPLYTSCTIKVKCKTKTED